MLPKSGFLSSSSPGLHARRGSGHQRTGRMLTPKTAAYGSWKSPITSALVVAKSITLYEARFDGEDIYWLEGRPQELGRLVVVRANAADGHARDVTPNPFNARARVHEYGGGSWTVADGDLYFSNFADGRLYRQTNNSSHPVDGEPINTIVAVDLHQPDRDAGRVLVGGHDF